jgi:adenylate kinase
MILVLIGPQGSGKGTQAKLLAEKFHLIHLEPGSIFRQEASQTTPRAKILDNLLDQGILIPDGIVIDTIRDFIEAHGFTPGYVLDGHPRTLPQYQALKNLLTSHSQTIDQAIYLEIDDHTAITRLSSRLNCRKCGKIFNKITHPPPPDHATTCGGQLYTRDDDQPQAVRTRLNLYHQLTEPLLMTLKKDGILVKVNATPPIPQVFQDILQIIQSPVS